jgi:hypothetical protein
MAENFAWLNPHLTIALRWNDAAIGIRATNPEWRKWRACDPTSAHWYDQARLERYMAAHIARDQDLGRDRTVREFIAEFRGLSGSAKQKVVLEQVGAARTSLSGFFGSAEQVNHDAIARLLAACRTHTRPVKPADLGLIGREHLLACFEAKGVAPETFKYQKALGEYDSIPFVIETAFGWCPDGPNQRRIITGANWSVAINNPFRSFGRYGESLDSVLTQQRAGRDEPIVFVLHLACPRIDYTDRGKSAIVVPGAQRC